MPGILYVVSTPIGNPEDLTFRALRVLQEVHWIAAKHSRITKQLLDHYSVETPITTYHTLNAEEKAPVLTERLLKGQSGALVSDAGTPVIFDPGFILISQAIASHIQVVPVPGPSAPLAAASGSGLPADALLIQGYVPARSEARRRFLNSLRAEPRTSVLLIQSDRLRQTLERLQPVLGRRRLALAKNLTMPDEEFFRGTAADLLDQVRLRPIKGELTLVIEGRSFEPE